MREKLHYSDSEITNNLYTFGKEYMLNNVEYKGFYHKYTTGEIYTLKKYNAVLSRKLTTFSETNESKNIFNQLNPNLRLPKIENNSESKTIKSVNNIIVPPDINNPNNKTNTSVTTSINAPTATSTTSTTPATSTTSTTPSFTRTSSY